MIDYISTRYGTGGGASKLELMSDVDYSNIQDGGILQYNATSETWTITDYNPGEAITSDSFKYINSTGELTLTATSSTDTLNIEVNGNSTYPNLDVTTDDTSNTLDISLTDAPKFEYLDFNLLDDTVTPTRGRLWYNIDDDTLNLGHADSVVQQVGQEFFLPPTINTSGELIENGSIVMLTAVQGDRMEIAKAVSDGTIPPNRILGVATADIPINSDTGKIATNGIVRNVDTNGWSAGTVLYHDPLVAGGWTSVKPEAPAIKAAIGLVLRGNSTTGWIYVRMNIGSTLGETDSNVEFDTLVDKDFIVYDGVNERWRNKELTLSDTSDVNVSTVANHQSLVYDSTSGTWQNEYHPLGVDIQRCGFLNQTETELFFNDTATAVTNAGTSVPAYSFQLVDAGAGWSYYLGGKKYTITGNRTVSIPSATAGTYFVTIQNNSNGDLNISGTIWDLTDVTTIPVVIIRFDSTLTPTYWMEEERHTVKIDRRSHLYHHTTRGTVPLASGGLSGYTLNTATDAATTFGIGASKIADEDIILELDPLVDQNGTAENYVIFDYNGSWNWQYSLVPFLYATDSYIQWNNNGTPTTGIANHYYNTYVWYTNFYGDARYVITLGQGEYDTLAQAQAEDPHDFDLEGIEVAEYVIAYQLTWETKSNYTNLGKVTLATDPKQINITTTSASIGTTESHNSLGGLQGGTTDEYFHLTSTQHTDLTSLNTFNTVAVSGQNDVVADTISDTLTFVAGSNITITTDDTTDSITINSAGSSYTAGEGLTLSGSEFSLTPYAAGSVEIGALSYNGTTQSVGKFDGGTTNPISTDRLNYDGNFHATNFYGDGSNLTGITSGATLTDDTATDTTQYLGMSRTTTGAWTEAYTASTKLYFNPSTGTLNSTEFNSLSDENYKTNILKIDDASSTIDQLEGVEFNWIGNNNKSAGIIAQELEQILPHLVSTNDDGIKSVNYNGLVGYLIEGNKELNKRVTELENIVELLIQKLQ